jgi:3-keto-disaccharide hydrolase
MKHILLPIAGAAVLLSLGLAQNSKNPFLGRWDITVTTPRDTYPDWMELSEKDGKLDAFIQPRAGGASHHSEVKVDGDRMTVTLGQATWELTAQGDRFTGSLKRNGNAVAQLAGVRAPKLDRPMPKAWTEPEPIFNGKDLTGWEPIGNAANHWVAQDGDLLNETKGANIRTTRSFNDFKLHVEFNCPDKGNSGIYLRGRYEVQVEYEPAGTEDKYHSMGAIYSFVPPMVELPRKPGQWESFDITLVGRRLTILRNGVLTIDNQEIPGPTGGALDSHEGEPGPFYIQGDHTGGMRYRNIRISTPKA